MKLITDSFKAFLFLSLIFVISCNTAKTNKNQITVRWMVDEAPHRYVAIRRFEQQNPNIKIQLLNGGTFDKLLTMLAAGDPPEIFAVYNISQGAELATKGVLMELETHLTAIDATIDDFWPSAKEYMIYNGTLLGLPENCGVNLFYYNKNLFDYNGVPYPQEGWDYNTFIDIAKKLTTDSRQGKKSFGINDYKFWRLLYQSGGSVFDKSLTKYAFDTAEAKEAMEKYHKLHFLHKCIPSPEEKESLGGKESMIQSPFMSGQMAMSFDGHWMTGTYRTAAFDWDIILPPRIKNNRAPFASKVYMMPKNISKTKVDASLKFLAYLMSEQNMKFISDRADGLPSRISISKKPYVLFNEVFPKEKNNHLYLEAMKMAYLEEPFNPNLKEHRKVGAMLNECIFEIRNSKGKISATEALAKMQKIGNEALSAE